MEHTESSPDHPELAPVSSFKKILRAHRNRERGAVLVEAAIAIPLLLFVILGSVEFGVGWEAKSATTGGLRSGLLRASALANEPETDLRTLQSIVGEIGADNADRISWVVIFDADPGNGTINEIVDECRDAVLGGGTRPFCVGYTQQNLIDIATTNTIDFTNFDQTQDATCDTGLLDSGNFCATSRTLSGDIEVGVAFEYQHRWLTGILPFGAPTFREVQTSSTFTSQGADINGTNAVVAASGPAFAPTFAVGGSPNTTAGSFSNGSINSTTFGPALGPFGPTGGPGSSATTLDVTSGISPAATEICVTFYLIITGGWDPDQDSFTVQIGGESQTFSNFDQKTGEETTRKISLCDPMHSGTSAQVTFSAWVSVSAETWSISNVTVGPPGP